MRLLACLLLAASVPAQTTPPPRAGLKPVDLQRQGSPRLKLWLPDAYAAISLHSRRWERKPSISSPDIVTLRLDLLDSKLPDAPAPPSEADLLRVDPSLTHLKFSAEVATWRGRPVPSARFEGFVQGKIGVFGRMVWLPLEPGTVVLQLYAEPSWVAAMNQDWDVILATIEGTISERTLRERSPGRWLASTIAAAGGILVALVGVILILYRMTQTLGGPVVYLGLLLPVFPVGYALLHLRECWRGLLLFGVGVGAFGIS